MSKRKAELVVKSNKMIEASYRLNLVEQQIILFALCRSREEQKGFSSDTPITIKATDFADQFGTNIKLVYTQLKEAIETLYDRSVTIHDIEPITGKERVTETRWISDKSYIDGSGQIQLTFAAKIIPFITRLGEDGKFTSYRLEKIGGMSSTHAVRLYEFLVQYLSIGEREIEILWLKETLQLKGQYKSIKDLKKYVIDLSVTQINKYSDINVSYTQRKKGVSITHFIFKIESKVDNSKQKYNKKITIDKEYIDKHANPGESYEQAYKRLTKNNIQFKNEKIIPTESHSLIENSNLNEYKNHEEDINLIDNEQDKSSVIKILISPNQNNAPSLPKTEREDNYEALAGSGIDSKPEISDKSTRPWWKFWK